MSFDFNRELKNIENFERSAFDGQELCITFVKWTGSMVPGNRSILLFLGQFKENRCVIKTSWNEEEN